MAIDFKIVLEGGKHALAKSLGRFLRVVTCHNRDELVTPDAREICAFSGHMQAPGSLAEQAVAYQMAVDVVRLLEPVEVETHDGKLLAAVGGLAEGHGEIIEE